MSNNTVRLAREKTHAFILAFLEIIMGVMTLYLGWQFIESGSFLGQMMGQIGPFDPSISILSNMQTSLYVIGSFIVLHGVKRVTDKVLRAWVKSAKPESSTEQPKSP